MADEPTLTTPANAQEDSTSIFAKAGIAIEARIAPMGGGWLYLFWAAFGVVLLSAAVLLALSILKS